MKKIRKKRKDKKIKTKITKHLEMTKKDEL